jgi:hypothetical protein
VFYDREAFDERFLLRSKEEVKCVRRKISCLIAARLEAEGASYLISFAGRI